MHVDLDAYEIAKNHPVDLGVVADPQLTLARLAERLVQVLGDGRPPRRAARVARRWPTAGPPVGRRASWPTTAPRRPCPLHPAEFAEELAQQLPADAVIFDEALTNSPALTRYRPGHARAYLLTRGGSLGVGIPGAIGVKLAQPDKTVIGVTGDGGAMYTIQALWTAARHDIDAKFVICNNRSYRLLQLNITQ